MFSFDPNGLETSQVDESDPQLDSPVTTSNQIIPRVEENIESERFKERTFPFAATYHSKYSNKVHQGSSQNINEISNNLHPKLQKRTNIVREIVARKQQARNSEINMLSSHPKYKLSQKRTQSNAVSSSLPRTKRSVDMDSLNSDFWQEPPKQGRSISNKHPKYRQHINSLGSADDNPRDSECGMTPHFDNFTMNREF